MLAPSEALVAITVTRLALNKAASESFSTPIAPSVTTQADPSLPDEVSILFPILFPFLTHFWGCGEGNFRHRMFQSYNNHLYSELPSMCLVWMKTPDVNEDERESQRKGEGGRGGVREKGVCGWRSGRGDRDLEAAGSRKDGGR